MLWSILLHAEQRSRYDTSHRRTPDGPGPLAAAGPVGPGPDDFELTVIGLPVASSEDVLIDADGSVLTALIDARIVRVWPDEHDPHASRVEVLVGDIDGVPLRFTNNSAVAADGTIYFTDSSRHYGVEDYKGDLLEHAGTGRLFRYRPDGVVQTLLDGLDFPNGVALAADESFVLFAQTGDYDVQRLWLTGPRQGEREVFVANLPGFPDNMALGSDGLFWVALPSGRNPVLDLLLPRHPLLRRIAWAIPERLQPKEGRTVFAQAFDADGRLVHDLQQPTPTSTCAAGSGSATAWSGSAR